jgi:Fusaric acid resistance protein family
MMGATPPTSVSSLPSSAIVNLPRLTEVLRAAGPPLLFGTRLWASVSLALYVAFWLELDNPFWAGTSAAIASSHYRRH